MVTTPIPSANSSSSTANQFLSGNAYMALDGPWSLINAREQAKFEVGMATNFEVVQAQRDLNDARNSELRQLLNYRRALIDFERRYVGEAAAALRRLGLGAPRLPRPTTAAASCAGSRPIPRR